MAKNTDTTNTKKQKGNIADKASDAAKSGTNKLLMVLNVVVFLFLGYQVAAFIGTYSKKSELMFNQGRIININTKNTTIEISDISDEEIEAKRLKKNQPMQQDDGKTVEDMIGPKMPEKKAEELVGPLPADAKPEEVQKEEAQTPAEPPKPLDYNTANLAVLITEVGPMKDNLEKAMTLPKEVTFAFSPYTDDLQKKIDATVKTGHMVLLNLMMQPTNFPMRDSGPLSIQVNYDENQNIGRFDKTTKLATRYSGLLSSTDEMVTSKIDKFSPLLKKVSERGMFIGYYKGTNNMNVENDAKPLAADIFGVDYLVDADPSRDEMENVLNQVKEDLVVKKKRVVIAIRAYPNSIDVMNEWLKKNVGASIQIAPISYFVTNN